MKKDFTRLIVLVFFSFLGLTLLILIGCGGGGGDSSAPAYNYSQLNGSYVCRYPVSNSYVTTLQIEFSSTNLRYTDTQTNQVQDINDFVGTLNGYPMYTERMPDSTTDSLGFLFTLPDSTGHDVLCVTMNETASLQQGNVSMLYLMFCKK